MSPIHLTLIGKPGCHLCDDARVSLDAVLASPQVTGAGIAATVEELNILDDVTLAAKYAEEIPVLLINGRMHSYWHIDKERLTRALTELSTAHTES